MRPCFEPADQRSVNKAGSSWTMLNSSISMRRLTSLMASCPKQSWKPASWKQLSRRHFERRVCTFLVRIAAHRSFRKEDCPRKMSKAVRHIKHAYRPRSCSIHRQKPRKDAAHIRRVSSSSRTRCEKSGRSAAAAKRRLTARLAAGAGCHPRE